MNIERDSRAPSIDLVLHVCLAVVLITAVIAFVGWPLLFDAMV